MKRKVLFVRKAAGMEIPGLGLGRSIYIGAGMPCNPSAVYGGGNIGEMEYVSGAIVIRKVTADGKPHRNFGSTKVGNPPQTVQLEGDGVMIPLTMTEGIVFADVPEPAKGGGGK